MKSNNDNKENEIFLVGIGASAGGLEALEKLFNNIPDDTGMTYVVIQHLSPDYKSMMMELLSKHTSMSLHRIEDGMDIKPDTVYLIPPKKNVEIVNKRFKLLERPETHGLNLPIDIFFKSLAYEYTEKSMGVVLSGTGTDGTLGVRTIKEYGGLVIIQDPETAKFDGMPRSALSTGIADYVLAPEDIPFQMVKYAKHPAISKSKDELSAPAKSEDHINKIYTLLKNRFGLDFTHYKKSTIYRRVERRLGIKQFSDLEDYVEFLRNNPGEMDNLYKELLIGVTKFFRDYEAYEFLKQHVVPEIINKRKEQGESEVRCWISACSTGEEAYSLAILFLEHMENINTNLELKIFATDIDKDGLDYASNGFYPESIVADINSERLMKYFIKEGDYYKVTDNVRKKVVFAKHNLIQDPPFNKIDLVSCRNLLIYFQPVLQKRVLSYLYFSLKKFGYMFLGSSETVGDLDYLFKNIHNKWKIYQKIGETNRAVLNDMQPTVGSGAKEDGEVAHVGNKVNLHRGEDIVDDAKDVLIEKHLPSTVIVDENFNLHYVLNNAERFIKLPQGKAQFSILSLVPKHLSTLLSTLINKAQKDQKSAVYKNISMDDNSMINLMVEPGEMERTGLKYYIVTFEETKQSDNEYKDSYDDNQYSDDLKQRIRDLEHELTYTKENLQATIEELETSNEELQATNEELLSSNEELQSTNEELQSVNEELITVNAEYQNKIEELTQLNNDVNNLLSATEIGTVFLDTSLCVRKFTPAVSDDIFLIENDIGRPIKHISHNLLNADLDEISNFVFKEKKIVEKEVETKSGKTFFMRVLPYKVSDKDVKGVVITLINITELTNVNEELKVVSTALDQSPSLVVVSDSSGTIEYVNNTFEEVTGYKFDESYGKKTNILKSGKHSKDFYKNLWKTVLNGKTWKGEFTNVDKNGGYFVEEASIVPIKNKNGNVIKLVKLANEVTNKKAYLEELKKMRNFLEKLQEPIFILTEDAEFYFANEVAVDFLGYEKSNFNNKDIFDVCPNISKKEWENIWSDVKDKRVANYNLTMTTKSGSSQDISLKFSFMEISNEFYVYAIIN